MITPRDLVVSSPDIAPDAPIDARFSGYGDNLVPALTAAGIPEGTVELALIVHDPDAPAPHGFTHWVRYGIPADETDLSTGLGRDGLNDAGGTGYTGPKPPPGHGTHHYYFWVYALDTAVAGEPSRAEFLARYGDRILELNRLVGTFDRPA